MAGFTLNTISIMIRKLISIVRYITRYLTTCHDPRYLRYSTDESYRNVRFVLSFLWASWSSGRVEPYTTPLKRSLDTIFNILERRVLVLFIKADPIYRRIILGEVLYVIGYICSEATVRRALIIENLFRFITKL
jgi:hypothetical protein